MKSEEKYSAKSRVQIYRKASAYLFIPIRTGGICRAFRSALRIDIYFGLPFREFPELSIISHEVMAGTYPTSSAWFDGSLADGNQEMRQHRGWALLFAAEIAGDKAARDKKNAKKNKEETK